PARVLQPHRAGVAAAAQVLDPVGDGQSAGAGGAPARGVGDLHVGDPVAVGGDLGGDVRAVDGEMVDVAEQPEVGRAVLRGDPVQYGDGVGGGPQRIGGGS